MAHAAFEALRNFVVHYGYWAVVLALLCENAGIPVPGETALLLASFLAYSERQLHLGWIIVAATCAATLGDNLGYLIGYHGGRPLLERYQHIFHIPRHSLLRGERLFERFGAITIFFARFIFGMRIFAGPMAGVLRMPWRAFALFNFLGAALWVTVISLVGYFFGRHWDELVQVLKRVDVLVVLLVLVLAIYFWRQQRRHPDENE